MNATMVEMVGMVEYQNGFSKWLACMIQQLLYWKLEYHNGWNGRIPQWLLSQDGLHVCYISYSIRSLNGTMVEMVEYHNGYFLKIVSMYVTLVTLLKGWMPQWLKLLNNTMVTFSRWLASLISQ